MTQRPFDQTLAQTLKALRPAPDNRDAWSHEGRAFAGEIFLASVVGEFPAMELSNPPSSPYLVAVDGFEYSGNNNGLWRGGIAANQGYSGAGFVVDLSGQDRQSPVVPGGDTVGTAPDVRGLTGYTPVQESLRFGFSSPALLPPGKSLVLFRTETDVVFSVLFFWREFDL